MASIASIISWQNNAEVEVYGVAMVTLANQTDINSLRDLVGKIVSTSLSWSALSSSIPLCRL